MNSYFFLFPFQQSELYAFTHMRGNVLILKNNINQYHIRFRTCKYVHAQTAKSQKYDTKTTTNANSIIIQAFKRSPLLKNKKAEINERKRFQF